MMSYKHLLVASLATLMLLPACGNNNDNGSTPPPTGNSLTCGEGTRRMAGECVPISDLATCGQGTMLVDGECVATETGGNNDVTCGAGTTNVDGKCVPDAMNVCGQGTMLDEATGRCVATAECGPQTTLVDGQCLADDDILANEATLIESDTENDPAYGGTPEMLALPAVGDSTLALGVIGAPRDLDGDNARDQDVDVWQFSATAGDTVNVKLLELGAGALAFEVRGPQGFYRQGPGFQPEPERALFLPFDGDYQITIRPQLQLFQPEAGPSGSDDARYRLAVTNLGGLMTSDGTPFDIANMTPVPGELLALEQNLYLFQYTAPALWRATITGIEDRDATVALIVLDGQGTVRRVLDPGTREVILNGNVDNDRWLFVDWTSLSSERDDYELRVEQFNATAIPDTLEGGATVDRAGNIEIDPQQSVFITATIELVDAQQNPVDQGLVIDLEATRLDQGVAVNYEVFSPSGARVQSIDGSPFLFLASESGNYLIKATNLSPDEPQTLTRVSLESFIPTQLGTLAASGDEGTGSLSVIPGKPSFGIFSASNGLVTSISMENSGFEGASLTILSDDGLQPLFTSDGMGTLTLPPYVVLDPGPRVVQVASLGGAPFTATVGVDAISELELELEPNNRPSSATPIRDGDTFAGKLPLGDVDHFSVTATSPALVNLFTSLLTSDNPLTIEVISPNGEVFERPPAAAAVSRASFIAAPGQTYTVRVSSPNASREVSYSINAQFDDSGAYESEPNSDSSTATALVAENTDYIGAGTVTGITDEDWFSVTLNEETFMEVGLERLGDIRSPSQTLSVIAFDTDGMTALGDESLVLLPAGTSFFRVRSANNTGTGNTYNLRLSQAAAQDLGVLSAGTAERREGTFSSGQTQATFTFEVPANLPATHDVIVWSSATLDVFDAGGNAIHLSADSNQFFGSAADGSFAGNGLAPGTYQVVIRDGQPGQNWSLFAGALDPTEETEPNDTQVTGMSIGDPGNGPIYIYGDMPPNNTTSDFFTFQTTGMTNVRISQYQIGETVADLDLAFFENQGIFPTANVSQTPQVISQMVSPGMHNIQVTFTDDVAMNSRRYLLVVEEF
ncbi:MAG: hypothetical protein VYE40_01935 [Myxococcota bacterium]|nr:hypothetical protein [Myxococcota bacterium]